jgi:hypothetical protein
MSNSAVANSAGSKLFSLGAFVGDSFPVLTGASKLAIDFIEHHYRFRFLNSQHRSRRSTACSPGACCTCSGAVSQRQDQNRSTGARGARLSLSGIAPFPGLAYLIRSRGAVGGSLYRENLITLRQERGYG